MEERGGKGGERRLFSGNVAEDAFCLKSAPVHGLFLQREQ